MLTGAIERPVAMSTQSYFSQLAILDRQLHRSKRRKRCVRNVKFANHVSNGRLKADRTREFGADYLRMNGEL